MPKHQPTNKMAAGCSKRLAGQFHLLRFGHCSTGQFLRWAGGRAAAGCWWCWQGEVGGGALAQGLQALEAAVGDFVGEGVERDGMGNGRFKIRELFADERCTQPVLDFLRVVGVGRGVGTRGVMVAAQGQNPGEGGEGGAGKTSAVERQAAPAFVAAPQCGAAAVESVCMGKGRSRQ